MVNECTADCVLIQKLKIVQSCVISNKRFHKSFLINTLMIIIWNSNVCSLFQLGWTEYAQTMVNSLNSGRPQTEQNWQVVGPVLYTHDDLTIYKHTLIQNLCSAKHQWHKQIYSTSMKFANRVKDKYTYKRNVSISITNAARNKNKTNF